MRSRQTPSCRDASLQAPSDILEQVNANHHEVLYRCRWSEETTKITVPLLVDLLGHDSAKMVAESLRALHRIGPAAFSASAPVRALITHRDPVVSHLAVSTLGRLCLDRPDIAVAALLAAAERPHLLEPVLAALINFGKGASCGAPLFATAYDSRNAKIRWLAIRAILSSRVTDPLSMGIVEQAKNDPNGEVRKAAAAVQPEPKPPAKHSGDAFRRER